MKRATKNGEVDQFMAGAYLILARLTIALGGSVGSYSAKSGREGFADCDQDVTPELINRLSDEHFKLLNSELSMLVGTDAVLDDLEKN